MSDILPAVTKAIHDHRARWNEFPNKVIITRDQFRDCLTSPMLSFTSAQMPGTAYVGVLLGVPYEIVNEEVNLGTPLDDGYPPEYIDARSF